MAETFRAARSPYEKHTTRCANREDEIGIRADDESDIIKLTLHRAKHEHPNQRRNRQHYIQWEAVEC
jgi:hypothetical protein